MTNKILAATLLILALLAPGVWPAAARQVDSPSATQTNWTGPDFAEGYYFTHPDIDDSGLHMVGVDGGSDNYDDNAKNIVLSTFSGSAWGPAQILANNAVYSTSLFQDPPRDTSPVISGDGETIAYLGYNAAITGWRLYIIDKVAGVWGAPYEYTGWDGCVDNELDISADGNTIVFSNCPSLFSTMRIFVTRRVGGVWSPYEIVSGSGASKGGAQGSISADGERIVYQSADHLYMVELLGDGTWSAPRNLTKCYLDPYNSAYYLYHPKLSPDGNTAFYWKFDDDSSSGQTVVVNKGLYAMRRFGNSWSPPVLVSGGPITPDLSTGSPPAVDETGTRVIFSRELWGEPAGDPFPGSRLEIVEWQNGAWTSPVPLTGAYDAQYPSMTPDGGRVVFRHRTDQAIGLATLTVNDLPGGYSYDTAVGNVPVGGGSLSGAAGAVITFPMNAMPVSSEVTLTGVTGAGMLPHGLPQMDIGRGFDLSALANNDGMPVQADPAYPYTILVGYGSAHGPVIESSLGLYAWQEDVCSWTPLASSLDLVNHTVTASDVQQLGLFALRGDANTAFLPIIKN